LEENKIPYKDPERERERCFHHSNLQPKFSKENLSKMNRFADPSLHQFMGEIKIK